MNTNTNNGFRLYSSNRQERLLQLLTEHLRAPRRDPLKPEYVVVANHALKHWLSLQLAQRLGILANVHFLTPRDLLMRVLAQSSPDFEPASVLSSSRLSWLLLAALLDLSEEPDTLPFFRQLQQNYDPVELYNLSQTLAALFEDYINFRPQMITNWAAGCGEGADSWQAVLYRRVLAMRPDATVLHRWQELSAAAQDRRYAPPPFCERLFVFGVSRIAGPYAFVFGLLGRSLPLHFYLLTPSRWFWFDQTSPKAASRRLLRESRGLDGAEGLDGTEQPIGSTLPDHPLLAGCGKTGRIFFEQMIALGLTDDYGAEHFVEPAQTHLLGLIQGDLLDPYASTDTTVQPLYENTDYSVCIYACSSPRRELESLRDYLIAAFARDPQLRPDDVLVLMPEPSKYQDLIPALFGEESPELPIPWCLDQQSTIADHAATYLDALELLESRFEAAAVLALLSANCLAQSLELTAEDVRWLAECFERVQLRWGIDGQHRTHFESPKEEFMTWEDALNRLMCALAFPEEQGEAAGLFPTGLEGGRTAVLGKCMEFYETLKSFATENGSARGRAQPHRYYGTDRTLEEWQTFFIDFWRALYGAEQGLLLPSFFRRFGQTVDALSLKHQFPFALVRGYLGELIRGEYQQQQQPRGQVYFASMDRAGSIPHRVVAILGASAGDFPRVKTLQGFDLRAQQPQAHDFYGVDMDRYFFLESLLLAESQFFISYVESAHADAYSGSLVLQMLYATADRVCRFHNAEGAAISAEEALLIRPPEQLYRPGQTSQQSNKNSQNSTVQGTYSRLNWKIAVALQQEAEPADFFAGNAPMDPLGTEYNMPDSVNLYELQQFFKHPQRELLSRRYGISLLQGNNPLDQHSDEPLSVAALDEYNIRNTLLAMPELLQSNNEHGDRWSLSARVGLPLPLGYGGLLERGRLEELVAPLRELFLAHVGSKTLERHSLKVPCGDRVIHADLHCYDSHLITLCDGEFKPFRKLSFWLEHLVLQIGFGPRASHYIARDKNKNATAFRLEAVADASQKLEKLLHLYRSGMSAPLAFYLDFSYPLFEGGKKFHKQSEWEKTRSNSPELRFCFAETYTPDDDWDAVARELFVPLEGHLSLL